MKKLLFAIPILAAIVLVGLFYSKPAHAQVTGSLWKLSANYLFPVNSSWGLAIPGLANNNCIGTDASGKFQAGTCGAASGSGVSTSSQETAGYIPVWTSTHGSPALLAGTSQIFQSGSNIGIGTTSPSSLLYVQGAGTFSSGAALPPALSLGGDINATTRSANTTKLAIITAPNYVNNANVEFFSFNGSSGSNTVNFGGRSGGSQTAATTLNFLTAPDTTTTGGTVRMTVDTLGNVGIGTTSPQYLLDLYGSAPTIALTNSGSSNKQWRIGSTGNNLSFTETNAATQMVLFAGGNVGIGEVTTANSKLAVKGGVAIGSATSYSQATAPSGGIIVQGNSGFGTSTPVTPLEVAGGTGGINIFSITRSDGTQANTWNAAISSSFSGAGNAGTILWRPSTVSADFGITSTLNGTAPQFILKSGGDVGIGTTTPNSSLTILGTTAGQTTANLNTTSTLGGTIGVYDIGNAVGNGGAILFGASVNGTTPLAFASIKALTTSLANNSAGDLAFSVRNSGTDSTLTEALRIKQSGNIGIGTTSPKWLLSLSTSIAPQLHLGDGAGMTNGWAFFGAPGGTLYIASTSPTTYATSSVAALTIDTTGAVIANCFKNSVGGSCITGGGGGVSSVSGTYPVVSSGGTTPVISLAFGTTTNNTWSGLQTFTNVGTTTFSGGVQAATGYFTGLLQLAGDLIINTGKNLFLKTLATPAGSFLAVDPNGQVIATSTPSASAAGSTGQVQFNNGGIFGADSNFFWDNTNKFLGIGSSTPTAALTVVGASTPFAVATSTSAGSNVPVYQLDNTGFPTYSGKKPTLSSCGTSSLIGTDHSGIVTITAGSPSTCQLNFSSTKVGTTNCMISMDRNVVSFISSYSTSNVVFGFASGGNYVFHYMCESFQ